MAGDKKGKKNGWYVLFLDGVQAGSFGSWRTGQIANWCAKSSGELNADEVKDNK
jgi:putative DNA primase/helicase